MIIFAAAACATAPEAAAPVMRDSLRALRWIAPQADAVKALTTAPVACEPPAAAPATERSNRLALGRLAFESPALLGGAAGRMGLSCASCHVNGRDNPTFFVEGVSGAPGTADVTSSLFSKVRGNGAFDPVPIPDLAARNGTQMKDRTSEAFRAKVHGLAVEEFDGQEPPDAVFDALLAYLDSLDLAHCADPSATTNVAYLDDYGSMMTASTVLLDDEAAQDVKLFYIRVARERLERLHERYPPGREASLKIEALSARFAEAAAAIRDGRAPPALTPDVIALIGPLFEDSERSLYNPDVLRAALAQ